jgi:hypothetical protein
VIIGAINTSVQDGHQIIGWVEDKQGIKTSLHWDLDGKFYGWDIAQYPYDLFLVLKTNATKV